jgi:hypothetical protein
LWHQPTRGATSVPTGDRHTAAAGRPYRDVPGGLSSSSGDMTASRKARTRQRPAVCASVGAGAAPRRKLPYASGWSGAKASRRSPKQSASAMGPCRGSWQCFAADWFYAGRSDRQSAVNSPGAVDAGVDRSYVSRLERGLENPTVAILDRRATALNAQIAEFFVVPAPGEPMPKPLAGGRRASR